MDKGILPEQKVDFALEAEEQCAFAAYALLFEARKVRRNGFSFDHLEQVDSGPLYITTQRLIFVGATASKTAQNKSIVTIAEDKEYLVVQKVSGRGHRFTFNDDLDLEAARLRYELIRGGTWKKLGFDDGSTSNAVRTSEERVSHSAPAKPIALKKGNSAIDGLLEQLDALVGLNPVKREARSLVNYLRVQRLRVEHGLPSGQMTVHLVFTGNPGTGKTTVARLLAQIYKAMGFLPQGHLVETDRAGLVGGYLGQTAIKTKEVIQKALGGVLFIDEAYALSRGTNAGESDSFGIEAIDTLLKAMEDNREQLVVIVAGYKEPMERFLNSNPGLRSRFTRYIDFPDYSPDQLLQILDGLARANGYELDQGARQKAADVLGTAFNEKLSTTGNGRLVRTLFEEACVRLADRLETDENITRNELATPR